jgi:hypothetical protein
MKKQVRKPDKNIVMDPDGGETTSAMTDWWYRAFIDVHIKHESPYSSETVASQAPISPQSPSLKRRRSDQSQDLGEKRQRVESGSSATGAPQGSISDGFAAMLAQATGAVMQQHAPYGNGLHAGQEQSEEQSPLVSQNEQNGHEGHSSRFTSDPHLYMRILSLPILESLVGLTPTDVEPCHLPTSASFSN